MMFVSLLLFVHSINSSHGWVPPQHRSIPIPSLRRATYLPHVKNSALNMALLPLPVDELEELLVVGPPSGPQYATYWGRTKREQYNRILESAIVSFLGVFFSYFLSFVMGTFVATVCGCLFAFWGILSPEFKARQRNWEFLGGRALVDPWMIDGKDEDKQGLYGSLFLGRVDDICVVENTASSDEYDLDEFENYTMETDELEQIAGTPYLLRVRMSDDEGRDLQLHARMSEEYIDIEEGMPVTAIMLSTSQSFSNLAAVTDVMVPDADCWVGDYPYLNRPELETLLAEDDELWDLLQSQGTDNFEDKFRRGDDDDEGDNTNELGSFYTEDSEKVPVRRRRK